MKKESLIELAIVILVGVFTGVALVVIPLLLMM